MQGWITNNSTFTDGMQVSDQRLAISKKPKTQSPSDEKIGRVRLSL